MTCPGIVYSPMSVNRTPKGGFTVTTEAKLISLTQGAIAGFGCTTAHDDLEVPLTGLFPIKNGDTIIDPGFGPSSLISPNLTMPPKFVEYAIGVNIDGVDRGAFTWTVDPSDPTGMTILYRDLTTATFPYIAGVTFNQITFNSIAGDQCGGVAWNPTQQIGIFSNYDSWFCCASGSFNCCGTFIPGPHFLIPRPDSGSLLPGQLQSSTPALQKMHFLSNYTFQFTNDFGRIKPQ